MLEENKGAQERREDDSRVLMSVIYLVQSHNECMYVLIR